MEDLGKAVGNGDTDAQFRNAHSLKSSSASMGAVRLAALCATLEASGREGQLGAAPQVFEEMVPLHSAVCAALKTHWLDTAA